MNRMRTPEEKEKILKDYLNGMGISAIVKKYQVRDFMTYRWLKKYKEEGLEGLKSKTGKAVGGYKGIGRKKPRNKIEELELEIMKKDIEIAHLKKRYLVKEGGVGEKVFVTFSKKNTK